MEPAQIVLLLVAAVIAAMVFRLCLAMGWHWGVGLLLGAIPIAGTFFFGIFGLIGSALFVGALYKGSA